MILNDEALVERVARALYEREIRPLVNAGLDMWTWDDLIPEFREQHARHLAEAETAIEAMRVHMWDDMK